MVYETDIDRRESLDVSVSQGGGRERERETDIKTTKGATLFILNTDLGKFMSSIKRVKKGFVYRAKVSGEYE